MANSEDLEAMQDLSLMIDGELVDKFGVIPDLGNECSNLARDLTLNYEQEWSDNHV